MSVSSVVGRLEEVPVAGVDGTERVGGVAADWSSVASHGWEASSVGGVGGVVETMLSINHSWVSLSLSLPFAIEGPVAKVVVGRLVVAPGGDSGIAVGVVGGGVGVV